MEGKLQFHSCLALMECTFSPLESPQLKDLYVCRLTVSESSSYVKSED